MSRLVELSEGVRVGVTVGVDQDLLLILDRIGHHADLQQTSPPGRGTGRGRRVLHMYEYEWLLKELMWVYHSLLVAFAVAVAAAAGAAMVFRQPAAEISRRRARASVGWLVEINH